MLRARSEGSLGGLVAYLGGYRELFDGAGAPVVPGIPAVGTVGYS